eukprot:5235945-Lingulodinium_polyedra.AAC.1
MEEGWRGTALPGDTTVASVCSGRRVHFAGGGEHVDGVAARGLWMRPQAPCAAESRAAAEGAVATIGVRMHGAVGPVW